MHPAGLLSQFLHKGVGFLFYNTARGGELSEIVLCKLGLPGCAGMCALPNLFPFFNFSIFPFQTNFLLGGDDWMIPFDSVYAGGGGAKSSGVAARENL